MERADANVCIPSLGLVLMVLSDSGGALNSSLDPPGPVCPAATQGGRLLGLQAGSGVRDALSWGDSHHAECCLSEGKQSRKCPDA